MMKRNQLREAIFRHLDGLVVVPVAYSLFKKGILAHLLKEKSTTLSQITNEFHANEGYLNVALRVLASQGFLKYEVDNVSGNVTITSLPISEFAFSLVPMYEDTFHLLTQSSVFTANKMDVDSIALLEPILKKFTENYHIHFEEDVNLRAIQEQMLTHIEGYLVGPIVVNLGMTGMFHKYFMESSFRADEFHKHPEAFAKILDFFVHLGWFSKKNDNYQFTEDGFFFAKRASAYGVTVSYLPMFKHIDNLLFGNASELRNIAKNEDEIHVNREMNVWGSGGAHSNTSWALPRGSLFVSFTCTKTVFSPGIPKAASLFASFR